MREIKFRAWVVNGKVMADWEMITKECDRFSLLKDDNFIFMQFTGLTDKNGVDIYEGDILISDLGRICKAEWHEYQAGFDCTFIRDTDFKKDIDMSRGFKNPHLNIFTEIIGNIHQNKDLLGG